MSYPRVEWRVVEASGSFKLALIRYYYRIHEERTQLKLLVLIAAILLTSSCGGDSSKPTHSASDFKKSKMTIRKLDAYQETYTGGDDSIISADGRAIFADGSTEYNTIDLHYYGQVGEHQGYCVFEIDDGRDFMQGKLDEPKIIRHCDGKTREQFQVGDVIVSITGHPVTKRGLESFHIDDLRGPTLLKYYSGHSPSDKDDEDRGE